MKDISFKGKRKREIIMFLDGLEKIWMDNPEWRFWQLLRNISGWPFIHFSGTTPQRTELDTFFQDDAETYKVFKQNGKIN
jgi:hypothetical protein